MPRPPSEPRASRPVAERIALSLIVGLSADSQVVLIKFRFIRGGTETIHLPKAVAATLLDGLTAAASEKAAVWDAASAVNVNAQQLLAVAFPRFTDEDGDPARIDRATGFDWALPTRARLSSSSRRTAPPASSDLPRLSRAIFASSCTVSWGPSTPSARTSSQSRDLTRARLRVPNLPFPATSARHPGEGRIHSSASRCRPSGSRPSPG